MEQSAIEQVVDSINKGESFILEAGAGSGKTYTLIQSINYILDKLSEKLNKTGQQIVCITFTNVAKDQIIERTKSNPLVKTKTIHEFLWDCIKNFQIQLHKKLEDVNNEYGRQQKEEGKRKGYEYITDLKTHIEDLNITYTEYGRDFRNGLITHEDVILISYYMFRDYPALAGIIADQCPFLFIDEYQDTELETIAVLLDFILKGNSSKIIMGFFGDSMQKIYNKGIGEIAAKYYKKDSPDKLLRFITKKENFRCSQKVISLLNNIRSNLTQQSGDANLPGKISFLYGITDYVAAIRNIENIGEYKILFLTHNRIADKLGYKNLLNVYNSRYPLYGRQRLFEKEDRFSAFFIGEKSIEVLFNHYSSGQYREFIEIADKIGIQLKSHKDKEEIKREMTELNDLRIHGTIGGILDFVKSRKLITIPDRIIEFERFLEQIHETEDDKERAKKDLAFYEELKKISYLEIINLFSFIEEDTAYSTKHGTKGDEFENVLVVIDDAAWRNEYNFNEMFSNNLKNPDRLKRTLNLFYVCCSRAKNKLIVLSLSSLDATALKNINKWFGNENVRLLS